MQAFYKSILDNLFDGVYFVDTERRITYWNLGAQRISGYSPSEVMGKNCADNLLKHITATGTELCKAGCPLGKTLIDGELREAEVYLHHKNGHRVPIVVRISPLRDENGSIIGAIEVFSDTTSCLTMQCELQELKQQSLVDLLTGQGNRQSATRDFERRRSELKRYKVPFGLLFIDIDNFKNVNDTHGHDAGDQVLIAVGKTIKSAVRAVDNLCRWGGDEFLVITPKVSEATFRNIAERMRRFVEVSPIPTPAGPLNVTVSIGGAQASPTDTLDSLTARADAMMYLAKQSGRNCAQLTCTDEKTTG